MEQRTGKVASIFETHDVDLGGLQEVLHNQFEWLQANLTDYSFVLAVMMVRQKGNMPLSFIAPVILI